MAKKQLQILDFKYGVIDSIEPQSIPRGASSRSLNWITSGTKIELRRGYNLLGTTANTGLGKITGLGVALKPDGTDIVYRTRKRKIEYLDTATDDWVEAGTNALPAAVIATDALGEDISVQPYSNPTGPQIWFNSPNSGPIKIMTANPASYTEMYVLGTNYKGYMRIKSGRQHLWNRSGNPGNKTDLFASQLDVKADSDYTQISAEVIAGASGTLAFKGSGARRICFQVVFTVTSSGEIFTDNGDGTLTGSLGTTGATINYTTGAYAGVGAGTCTYRWADDTAIKGIANFTYSSTRVATEGFILAQSFGGAMQNIASLNGREYCLHERATWVVTISADDLDVTNLIYRSKVGIPNHRAMVESADGIYYIDDSDKNDVNFRILQIESAGTEVIPQTISKQFKVANVKVGVNLNNYIFDKAASIEFGELVLFACRTTDSDTNNRVFVYNKTNKATDILDYYVSAFAIYDGTLIAGDSVSDNVYTLLSGVDDDDSTIGNYWEGSLDNLGYNGMKRVVELTVDGEIGPDQSGKLSMSIDRGAFVEIGETDETITPDPAPSETETLVDSYSESFGDLDFSLSGSSSFYGQTFLNVSEGVLSSCKFYLRKSGSPVGSIYARLYALTGDYDSGGVPTGSPLATSDAYDSSTLPASFGASSLISFTFSGSNQVTMSANTSYGIVVVTSGVTVGTVRSMLDTTTLSDLGKSLNGGATGATWNAGDASDFPYYVYSYLIEQAADYNVHTYAIEGDGAYVDRSQRVSVGPLVVGNAEVGGGGDGIEAYHFRRTFRIYLDKFEYIKFRIEAMSLGYLSLTELTFADVRLKWAKVPNRYRVGR